MVNSTPFARTIKSFVKRQGRMTLGQKRAFQTQWPKYGIDYSPTPLDLTQIFSRPADKVVEIGFGMGESLAEMAKNNINEDYLGIEVHKPGVGRLLSIIEAEQINNIRVICHDAVEVINQQIADATLSRIQIFFPDPWHKKRHHKRRIIQPKFVQSLVQKLAPNGIIHIATDWQNYAEHIFETLQHCPDITNTAHDNSYCPRPDSRPLTKFEQRGQRLGHGVWDILFRKSI